MKIIRIDNFGRECISDVLVAENVPEHYADRIVAALNYSINPNNDDYFVIKPDDYKLYTFEP